MRLSAALICALAGSLAAGACLYAERDAAPAARGCPYAERATKLDTPHVRRRRQPIEGKKGIMYSEKLPRESFVLSEIVTVDRDK